MYISTADILQLNTHNM